MAMGAASKGKEGSMTQQSSRKLAGPGQIARRKRNRLMRSCSAFAAAIVLSGLWGNAAQAQMVAPPATARPAVSPASILQMRGAPEVRSIADANLIADSRITLQAPVVPRPQPAPQPANSQIRTAATADQSRIMEGSTGTVVIPGGPPPVVAARKDPTTATQGNFAVSSGTATINRSASKDQVQVTSAQAIINWNTYDTDTLATTTSYINFLPAGTELEFIGSGANYTVLNRVFGTPDAAGEHRGIAFNGTVTSRLSDAGPIGGNVWFYSPGGILVNNGAAFNVGSLVLSASALNAITGSGTTIDFTGVSQADSAILIANGANINALNQGSYVALVAPRIEQAGRITVNGSAAYVGAEQAQLRIDNGLFDIAIGLGTEDANGVVHTGTTTGPARQVTQGLNNILTDPDGQGIYMVAVPKNTALTMLVGGSIGYQPASNASMTPNGVLVLGSGTDVQSTVDIRSGTQTIQFDGRDAVDGGGIRMAGATLTSDMTAFASGQFALEVGNNQVFSMGGDGRGGYSLDATGGSGIVVSAIGTGSIDIQGDLRLDSGQDQSVGAPISIVAAVDPGSPTGPAGSINIGGSLVADSSGVGRDDFFVIRQNGNTGIGEDAVGGDISLTVSGGGSISVGGDTTLDASAQGGKGEFRSGSSTGGDVSILVTGATSSLNLPNFVRIATNGINAESLKPGGGGSAELGADSVAGNFSLVVNGGSLDLGFAQIDTSADATSGDDETQAQENTARAGNAAFRFTGGSQDIGDIRVFGTATSGTSFDADGNPFSAPVTLGDLTFVLDGSQTTFGQSFAVFAGAGLGDNAAAKTTTFTITNGANVSLGGDFVYDTNSLNDAVVLTVDRGSTLDIGGSLAFALSGRTSDIASDRGVDITINVDNASLLANFVALDSSITNDSFENLAITGGDIALNLTNGAAFDAGFTSISSNARGRALGSSATGGNVAITVDSSTFRSTGGVDLSANGVAAQSNVDTSNGTSIGQGGTVRFLVTGTTPLVDIGDLNISADGRFNFGIEEAAFLAPIGDPGGLVSATAGALAQPQAAGGGLGDGGDAAGGTVEMTIESGTFNAISLSVNASGFGENGKSDFVDDGINPPFAFAGNGGAGTGGTVTFNMVGGTANVDSLTVAANGLGGGGAFSDESIGMAAGNGGSGTGGSATINATGGSLNVTNGIALQALGNAEILDFGFPFTSIRGNGGSGFGVDAGNGGAGTGGSATLNLIGSSALVNAATIEISADAYGGEGGSGFTSFAAGVPLPGRNGGVGGDATGGTATLNHTSGTIDSNSVTVTSGAIGGSGGSSFGVSIGQSVGSGARGGNATGGTSTINLNQDDGSNPTYFVRSVSNGGEGGAGLFSGAGGNATGGTAELLVNNFDVSLAAAGLDASGIGGDGGLTDGEAGSGGAGGSGTGGTVRLVVDGPNGELTSDSTIAVASSGTGGAGSAGGDSFNDVDPGGNGGNGGLGTGGRAEIFATNGGLLDLSLDRGIVDARGVGGAGGAGGNGLIFAGGNGGRGGGAVGGAIAIGSSGGSDLSISGPSTTITLQAGAEGGRGGDGGLGAGGSTGLVGINGNSAGGTIDVTADGGRLAFNAQLAAIASATGFADTRPGSAGGNADGGAITIEALGAGSELVVTGGIFADASAAAALGVRGLGAGVGGSATGGSIDIVLAEGSTIDIASIDAVASGTGAYGNGGGSGTGGAVRIAIATDAASLTSINADVRATGGNSGTVTGSGPGQNGAAGGNALGGTAVVSVEGTGPLLDSLTGLVLDASATAGTGGRGSAGTPLVNGYLGGNGGNATGGTASLSIAGDGASLTVDALAFSLRADATGGAGGTGGDNLDGGIAGNGGVGGSGTGGTVSLKAGSGSTMTLQQVSGPFGLSASGFGGQGGSGGSLDIDDGGTQGTGGDGGTGTGGSPQLIATGGTIQGDDVSLLAVGFGGDGGLGGDDGNATLGQSGNGGDAFGGTPSIETEDGSPGIITLGNLLIDATSLAGGGTIQGVAVGGQVTITDASVDPLGLISMDSLTVLANGNASLSGYPSLTISSGSGPITVAGNVSADVSGDILLNFDDDGQLLVGGSSSLVAGGNIVVSHANNAGGTISLENTGRIFALAGGNFDAQAGSIVSGGEVSLLARNDVRVDDVRAVPNLQIVAGRNAFVNNAIATGPQGTANFGGILIEAGRDPFGSSQYIPDSRVEIAGTVDSYSDIFVFSGGTTRFLAGSTTVANDLLSVGTGGDIIVESGASLVAVRSPSTAPDPTDPFGGSAYLDLFAGALASFLTLPSGSIASIVVDGSLDANAGAIIARGNAIDGLDGSFTASSMAFDIDDAPADGVLQDDDGGLLSANCLEGNICLGSIFADNVIEVGQESNNDVIQLIVQQGTVDANTILITTRNDIVMGTNGIATTLNAADLFSIESTQGDIDLRDAAISSNRILIAADGSLEGNGSLVSDTDIGITVGDSLSASVIDTGGQLTTVAEVAGDTEAFYSVPNNITIGTLSIGEGDANFDAGGNIDIGVANVPGTDIILTAPGLVQLGFTDSANNINLDGGFVSVGEINAGGQIELVSGTDVQIGSATAGDTLTVESQGNVSFSSLRAGSDLTVTAPGTISGGDLFAGSLRLDGGFIAIGTASASTIDFVSGSDILFDLLQSSGPIVLTAANGQIAAHTAAGDIESDSNVTLLALAVDIGSIQSGGVTDVRATGGDAQLASITSSSDARVTATGNVTLGAFSAGRDGDAQADSDGNGSGDLAITGLSRAVRNLNLYGANVALGDVTVTGVTPAPSNRLSGFVTINSTNGSVNVGNVTAPGMTLVAEGGNLTAGNLRAFDPVLAFGLPTVIDLSAFGGDISVASLDSVGDIAIFTDGGAQTRVLGATTAGNDIFFSGTGEFAFDGLLTAGRDVIGRASGATGADITLGAGAVVGRNLDLVAANGVIQLRPRASGSSSVGGNLTFSAREIGLGAVNVGGNLGLTATAGNIDARAAGSVGGSIAFDASGNVDFGDLAANGGSFTVDAGGTITFGSASAANNIVMTTLGVLDGGDLTAGGTLSLDAGSVAFDTGSAGMVDITSGSDIRFNGLASASAIRLTAANGTIARNGGEGDIDSDGDVDLLALSVDLGDIVSGGSVGAQATSGDARFGVVDAADDITIVASGSPVLANAISGGDTSITGASVTFNNGTIGGNLALTSTAGNIASDGTVTVGGGITLDAADNVSFASLAAQGGNFTITAGGAIFADHAEASGNFNATAGGDFTTGPNSIITGGDIVVNAGSIVNLGNSSAGGLIDVQGSEIRFTTLDAGSTVDLLAQATQNTVRGNGTISGGAIDAGTGASSLVASGAINLTGPATIGGSLLVDAGGDVVFPTANTGGDLIVTAGGSIAHGGAASGGALEFEATGDIQGTGDLVAAGNMQIASLNGSVIGQLFSSSGSVSIDADGAVSFGTVSANANIGIEAGGPVSGQLLRAGSSIQVQTSDAITVDTVDSANTSSGGVLLVGDQGITLRVLSGIEATLNSSSGAVRVTEDVILDNLVQTTGESIFLRSAHDLTVQAEATVSTIDIETSGDLDVERAVALDDIRLYSTGGTATISLTSSGGSTTLPSGTQGTQRVTAGADVDIFGAADVVVRDRVSASGNLRVRAGDLVDLQAAAAGKTIEIVSRDIAIGTNGSLGEANLTDTIVFTPLTTEATLGGESSSTTGYRLDKSEFARVFSAGEISFGVTGSSSGGAVLTIDDLDVVAGAGSSATSNNIGQNGILRLESDGEIEVVGNLTVTGATQDTQLQLSADETILIDLANGGLFVLDGSNGLAGSIVAVASNFLAVTPEALAAIQGLSVAEIDDRLALNDGVDRPDGVIRADTLIIGTTDSQVFIQNTAPGTAFDERRGFTVNTLTINDLVDPNLPIVINGVVGSATGISAIALTNINTAFDPASTINGCLIANPSSCTVTTHSDGSSSDPLQDLLDDRFDGDPLTGGTIDTTLVELREDPLRSDDPLIDEPVTGAGNEDLWDFGGDEDEDCERAEDGSCIAEAAE
jgi:filamentous hemagglutinin family protein